MILPWNICYQNTDLNVNTDLNKLFLQSSHTVPIPWRNPPSVGLLMTKVKFLTTECTTAPRAISLPGYTSMSPHPSNKHPFSIGWLISVSYYTRHPPPQKHVISAIIKGNQLLSCFFSLFLLTFKLPFVSGPLPSSSRNWRRIKMIVNCLR